MDEKQVTIRNAPGFVRDIKSGVIINTNEDGYHLILQKRQHEQELDSVHDKLAKLEALVEKLINDDNRLTSR